MSSTLVQQARDAKLGGADEDPGGKCGLTASDQIRAITRFHLDEIYPRFGLPRSLF